MISTKTKNRLSKISGIWLLISGTGLTVWGLIALGTFFASCGVNEQGYPTTNTVVLVFAPVLIPGLLFLLAGTMALQRMWWWLAFICLIILSAGVLWTGLIGGVWLIAVPVLIISTSSAVLLIFSKDNFY